MRIPTLLDRRRPTPTPTRKRGRSRPARKLLASLASVMLASWAAQSLADASPSLGPLPDPSARLLGADDASEYWTLYIELESGHRITQRFLLTNAGPGKQTAVAVGHLLEPGRAPYRYVNGRRRSRWTLSKDRLFFDIAASHLDLHRPRGELRITKDDIEIRLFFDFATSDLAAPVPRNRLPSGYRVDVLAVAAATQGSIHAPWMAAPIQTVGRTWMVHTWSEKSESKLLDRRIDLYGGDGESAFYGLQLRNGNRFSSHWVLGRSREGKIIESPINISETWTESSREASRRGSRSYPLPGDFRVVGPKSGLITLNQEWLRFDPLEVIPNPFRWFIRRSTRPQEVWADTRIDVTLLLAPNAPSPPNRPGANESTITSSSERGTESGSAVGSVAGVASVTFMNPIDRR